MVGENIKRILGDLIIFPSIFAWRNLTRGLKFPFQTQNYAPVLILGGILMTEWLRSLIIPQIIVFGYFVHVLRQTIRPEIDTPDITELLEPREFPSFFIDGVKAFVIFSVYLLSPQFLYVFLVNSPRNTIQNYVIIGQTVIPFFENIAVIGVFIQIYETSMALEDVLVGIPIIRLLLGNSLPIMFMIVLIYLMPAAIAYGVESPQTTLLRALLFRNISDILKSPYYIAGWVSIFPIFIFYFYLFPMLSTELNPFTIAGGSYTIFFIIASMQIMVQIITFYSLLVAFNVIGRILWVVRREQLKTVSQEVESIFTSPSAEGFRPSGSASHPGADWLENTLQDETTFNKNRDLLHTWIRRILPEGVMYRFESEMGAVGHRRIDPQIEISQEIQMDQLDDSPILFIWYS